MKYYVISKFYNDGKVSAGIIREEDYEGQQNESNKRYDQYVDCFESLEEANKFYVQCRRA